ncbi:MAG: DASH family cryptochrome [Cyanobacteria bacterium]|nr:DASH family cryptochrome [Cyanobacteriota bacterium]
MTPQSIGIIWFRKDLRVVDHPALEAAVENHTTLLPVYCLDPREWGESARSRCLGLQKASGFRKQFLAEALDNLKQTLASLGLPLLMFNGHPENIFPQLIQILDSHVQGAQKTIEPPNDISPFKITLYANGDIAPDEQQIESALTSNLKQIPNQGPIELKLFNTNFLYPPPPEFGGYSPSQLQVFTQFKKILEQTAPHPPLAIDSQGVFKLLQDRLKQNKRNINLPANRSVGDFNEKLRSEDLSSFLIEDIFSFFETPFPRPNPSHPSPSLTVNLNHFKGGLIDGQKRLDHYLFGTHGIQRYKETRNGMLKPEDSSKFSPWLALGCLSPREIYGAICRYEATVMKNPSTQWLVYELVWRDYFRYLLMAYGNDFFGQQGLKKNALQKPSLGKQDLKTFEAWCQGETGFPLVDACMKELNATGFMSNRGRQNVASFLTKTLGIDWRWGAEYFEATLIDYDVSSNWGNWLYAAGVGTDPRDRIFNVVKQGWDYDPTSAFVKHWLPHLANLSAPYYHQPFHLTPNPHSPPIISPSLFEKGFR